MADEFVDMMIDGKLTKVSQKILNSRGMKQKRIEVEIGGKTFRVPEHMVEDMQRFGASLTKRQIKDPPPELLNMTPKKVIIPKTDLKEIEAPVEEVKEVVAPPSVVKKPVRKKKNV